MIHKRNDNIVNLETLKQPANIDVGENKGSTLKHKSETERLWK